MSKGTIPAVSLAAYVQSERTLKACGFCKDKKLQDVRKCSSFEVSSSSQTGLLL